MPANSFYASNKFPTIFDYTNNANENGLAIIDEIKYESNFLAHAMLTPTNDGLRERYTRKSECNHKPKFMSLDEHYTPSEIKLANEEKSFGTMRIGDRLQWEHRQDIAATPEQVATQRAEELKAVIDGMVQLKQETMLYSASQEDNASTADAGKKEAGLFSMLENIYDADCIQALYTRYEDRKNPFTNVGEKMVALSNYSANRTQKGSNYDTTKAAWTSIIGVAFGPSGVVTTYPSTIHGNAAVGFNMDIKKDIEGGNATDGYYTYDRINFDAYFGIGVKNRYCLNGIRNIFLGHANKAALYEEMETVENNLITLKDFFNLGQTGLSLAFYCSPRLITQMEMYQQEKGIGASGLVQYNAVEGTREFNGVSPRRRPTSLQITHDIVLYSDYCFKTSEKYVSGTMSSTAI